MLTLLLTTVAHGQLTLLSLWFFKYKNSCLQDRVTVKSQKVISVNALCWLQTGYTNMSIKIIFIMTLRQEHCKKPCFLWLFSYNTLFLQNWLRKDHFNGPHFTVSLSAKHSAECSLEYKSDGLPPVLQWQNMCYLLTDVFQGSYRFIQRFL